ncbi:hypothetical protein GQ44DRAFT_726598 [Phaeosphaeriaceae sp. PMI808]|nr:hypothetical protein GQ44DRAFT_726598 [Phaeosphaeriaceae sp. PMI808]
MLVPLRNEQRARVDYVVVERDGADGQGQSSGIDMVDPVPEVDRILRRSYTRRQPDYDDDYSDSDDELEDLFDYLGSTTTTTTQRPFTIATSATPTPSAARTTQPSALHEPAKGQLANKGPTETAIVALQPPATVGSSAERSGGISQTTEHLLIAAGSIGATIIIVMMVLALYTMRKRGMSLKDVMKHGKDSMSRRRNPPPPPAKYGVDKKQAYDEDWVYGGKDMYPPQQAAKTSRSGSLSTQTTLQPLARSESFKENGQTFFIEDPPARQNSHRRDISATPSSPVLPIQDMRRSASTRNTRSLDGDEEAQIYQNPPRQLSALPAPPTFKQFLSNRPSISQRPALGGNIMSRFSWTNSNAPQTPRDASRDTVQQSQLGRDSFITTRSSVPRFRTINSWVDQQSTNVEQQRLKQQFRMTQSTTYSEGDLDEVPEMPTVPKTPKTGTAPERSSPLAGKDVKHQRHDTMDTAPIFKAHPGTEVRFSTRSTVPSEVLDMGRRNAAL